MISLIKFFFVFFLILSYFLVTTPFFIFLKLFPYGTKKLLNKIVSVYSYLLINVLEIEVQIDKNSIDPTKNYFIVSNHLSYTDILIISSIMPTSFVTSVDMKETPFLGQIIQLAGCLFVERRSRKNISKEIGEIEQALKNGLNVTVFPEATSTNGEQVLKFKRSLFQSALNAGADVLPISLNYTHINKNKVTKENRDYVCWYGDMDFASHLWKLCQCRKIKVKLNINDIIHSKKEKDSANIRDIAFDRVSLNYNIIS